MHIKWKSHMNIYVDISVYNTVFVIFMGCTFCELQSHFAIELYELFMNSYLPS